MMSSVKVIIWFIVIELLAVHVLCIAPPYTPAQDGLGNPDDLFFLVSSYFLAGYTMPVICAFLQSRHDIRKSVPQLKRICRKLGLCRRGAESPEENIVQAIAEELNGSGSCCGYRSMWQRLVRDHHLNVKRETVRRLLSVLDPEGVETRRKRRLRRRLYRNKGPHYLIHIDGYDKLKPYGFAIHGAIDGFSRRILWLEVGPTNNNPNVVASYFVDYMRQVNGIPHIIRADRGTENGIIQNIQVALRFRHRDEHAGYRSFLYGKSTGNQRIERWWGSMRAGGVNYWINFFKDMCQTGALDTSSPMEIDCLRYCFMGLLRADLHRISRLWNEHNIRSSKNTESQGGKPDEMFFLPQLFGVTGILRGKKGKGITKKNLERTIERRATDFKHDVDLTDLDAIEQHYCATTGPNGCSDDFEEAAQLFMQENDFQMPATCYDALVLFGNLRERFCQE